ncbi:hypothetical protein KLAF111653_15865 [Klebsiella africana]|uniref:Uncharacterized protein n=1 Tax=Klebsiella africana TaxID=2489010 RepID=A0A8B6IUP8_9ENTR|nr:hypothetical protein SB5857_03858 [Klebsiella africana]
MKKIHIPALCQPKELALQSIWGSTMFSLRLASRQVIIQQRKPLLHGLCLVGRIDYSKA